MSATNPFSFNDSPYRRMLLRQLQDQATPPPNNGNAYDRGWDKKVGQPAGSPDWERMPAPPATPIVATPDGGWTHGQPGQSWGAGAPRNYGYTYADPGGGWTPWSLYDGREGFDGTAVDGHYNAAADSAKWLHNGRPQNDRDRVWGWVFERIPNPGAADPATLHRVFLEEVARLRRDYEAPENRARGLSWATSPFAGYDKFLVGGNPNGGNPNGATRQPLESAWQRAIDNASSTPGASPVAGPNDPTNPYNRSNGPTGTDPNGRPTPAPAPPPAGLTTSPAGGKGRSVFGNAVGILLENPQEAYRVLMQRAGYDPDIHGAFDRYLRQRLGEAASAILSASQTNGKLPDNADAIMDEIARAAFTPGGNYYSYIDNVANKALGSLGATYGENASFDQLDIFIQKLLGLKADAANDVAASDIFNTYQADRGAYQDEAIYNGGVNRTKFSQHLAGTKFGKRFMSR